MASLAIAIIDDWKIEHVREEKIKTSHQTTSSLYRMTSILDPPTTKFSRENLGPLYIVKFSKENLGPWYIVKFSS